MQKSAAPVPSYGAAPVNAPPQQQPVYYQQDAIVLVGGQPHGVHVHQNVPYAAQYQQPAAAVGQQNNNYALHRIWLMVYSFAIGAIGAWLYLWGIYGININWTVWVGAIGLGYTAVFGLIAAASKNRAMIALNMLGLAGMLIYTLVAVIYTWIDNGKFDSGYYVSFGFCAATSVTFAVAAGLYKRVTRDLRARQEFEQSLIQGRPIMASPASGYSQVV